MSYFNLDTFAEGYRLTIASDSDENKQIVEASILFESMTSVSVSMHIDANHSGSFYERLKLLEILGRPENSLYIYNVNKNFLHSFRQYRNYIVHPEKYTKDKIPPNVESDIVREKLYEHIVEFLSKDMKLAVPQDLMKYDFDKPKYLAKYLERIQPRQIPYSKKTEAEVPPSSSADSKASTLDNEQSSKKKGFSKTLIGIASLIVILLAGLYFFIPESKNTSSQTDPINIIDSNSTDKPKLSSSEKDTIIKPVSQKLESSHMQETQPDPKKEKKVEGNQINFGDGNTFDNSNVSGGDMNVNSKK